MVWIGILLGLVFLATAAAFLIPALREDTPPPGFRAPEPGGLTVLLCHPPRADVETWARDRAVRVAGAAPAIGCARYIQLRRLPPGNIAHVLLRLSRSWPLAALCSLLEGLPLPPIRKPADRVRVDWERIEVFDFPDAAAARQFAEDPAWCQGCACVVMTSTAPIVGMPRMTCRTTILFFLRTRAFLSRDDMLAYWLGRHRARVVRGQPATGFAVYTQLSANALPGPGWDGVARLDYRDLSVLTRAIPNPRAQAANLALVRDETRFIDFGRSHLFVGEVTHRLPA